MKMIKALLILATWLGSLAWALPSDVNNPQGAIWHLRETGREKEAQALEDHIASVLRTAPVTQAAPLGNPTSPGYLVIFENNIFAIMKQKDKDLARSPYYEAMAFALDRLLGLNMVPVTVLREMNGITWSLQLFYPAHENDVQNLKAPHEYLTARLADLEVFDRIMGNIDRNIYDGRNLVAGKDGRLVAIDNSRVLVQKIITTLKDIKQVSASFKEGILRLSSEKIDDLPMLDAHEQEVLRLRFEEIQRNVVDILAVVDETRIAPLEIPKVFEAPIDTRNFKFMNMDEIVKAFGKKAGGKSPEEIRQVIERSDSKELIWTMLLANWKTYPPEVIDSILESSLIHQNRVEIDSVVSDMIVQKPTRILKLLKNEGFVRVQFYIVIKGLMKSQKQIHPSLRRILIQRFVDQQKASLRGMDFLTLFEGRNSQFRDVFAKELYQAYVKAGMASALAILFRLEYPKNDAFPKYLVGLFPEHEQETVRRQLISSMEKVIDSGRFKLDQGSGKSLADHIKSLRSQSQYAPTCRQLFGI